MSFPTGFDPRDWKAPPHTAWALRNVARFLPVATVATGATRPLPERPEPLDLDSYMAEVHATAVLVVRGGALRFERYAEGAGPADRPMLFSITKSILGLVALGLVHDGRIDPDLGVAALVPELAGTGFAEATLATLLAMEDGVDFDESYADPGAEIHAYSRHYWGESAGGTLAGLAALPTRPRRPGFAYRTPVADVVGWMLRRATGTALADLVSEMLWAPLGAEADALMIRDTGGAEIGGTGFCARPRDLARLALALLDPESGIVARAVVSRLFRGGDPAVLERAGYATRTGWSYHGLWWHLGGRRIGALGVHGQRLLIDAGSETALIVTGAAPSVDSRALDPAHMRMFDALCAGRV
jgi:CubicO group peptidase (beta-lactamase class C family)